jgi:hypothetical protein
MANLADQPPNSATGGCLMSPDCESGACRLALLGGRWMCCQCGGRGNGETWCEYCSTSSPSFSPLSLSPSGEQVTRQADLVWLIKLRHAPVANEPRHLLLPQMLLRVQG